MFNFDNSLISDFAKCEAHAIIKHTLGRQSRRQKLYADLGNVGHKAMEVHFGGGSRKEVLDRFEEGYDKLIPVGTSPELPEMEKENLKTILAVYCEKRPPSAFPFEVIEFETMAKVEIAEGLTFWTKRDMLVRDRQSGMRFPVDHKFRWGAINEWWTKKFRLSSQFSGYIWQTGQQTGEPCEKLMVNALSFGKLPDSTRKCSTHKVPYIECRREHAAFALLVYSRTAEQLEKWRQDAIFFAKSAETYFKAFGNVEMLRWALRRGTFNESCTFCEFADWCRAGFEPSMMEELTVYDPWKPWEAAAETTSATATAAIADAPKPLIWLYDAAAGKVFASDRIIAGLAVLNEPMALKELWRQGRESWMEVWKREPRAQQAMAEFARSQQGGKSE